MALWIELHRDIRIEAADKYGEPSCFSAAGNHVAVFPRTASMARKSLTSLHKSAERLGWHRTSRGWPALSATIT